jgi:hypothetical protein
LCLIPVANIYFAIRIAIEVAFLRGTAGPNAFGDEPSRAKFTDNYSMLFDRERYGINLYIAAGFLLASFLQLFTWQLVSTIVETDGSTFPPLPTMYYVVQFMAALLETACFLLCNYSVRKNWLLPLVFGGCVVVVGIIRRGLFSWLQPEGVPLFEPFMVRSMVFNFFLGFFLLAPLVYAVRLWEVSIWSLGLGTLTAMSLDMIFVQSVNAITGVNYHFLFTWTDILTPILDGMILAVLMYLGIILHFKQKRLSFPGGVAAQTPAAT